MAHDEKLAARIRELVAGEPGLTEQKMFGGIAFLVGGNMALTASGRGGIMVRVDPDESDALTVSTPATVVVMRGRAMRGWLRVDSEHLQARPELVAWVDRSIAFARSLPVKR